MQKEEEYFDHKFVNLKDIVMGLEQDQVDRFLLDFKPWLEQLIVVKEHLENVDIEMLWKDDGINIIYDPLIVYKYHPYENKYSLFDYIDDCKSNGKIETQHWDAIYDIFVNLPKDVLDKFTTIEFLMIDNYLSILFDNGFNKGFETKIYQRKFEINGIQYKHDEYLEKLRNCYE